MNITANIEEFYLLLPSFGALIGLDYGKKNIGVATSDPGRKVALPLCTLRIASQKGQLEAVMQLVQKHKACGIVIGFPLLLNGTESSLASKVKEFSGTLAQCLCPILLHDERFSSKAARKLLALHGLKPDAEDQVSASMLLEEVIVALEKLQAPSSKIAH